MQKSKANALRTSYPLGTLLVAAAALFLNSCATQQPLVVSFPQGQGQKATVTYPKGQSGPQPANPYPTETAPAPAPQTVQIPLTQYNIPDTASTSDKKPTTNQSRELVADANTRFVVHPRTEDYQGGAVIYPYLPDHVYQLFTAPLQLTDIELEPGEHIVSPPASGDTANFLVATSYNEDNGKRREHVFVKPIYAGKHTTIVINTDRRTYILAVYSFETTFMPLVSFQYPLELAQQQQQQLTRQTAQLPIAGSVSDLDFNYRIIPHTLSLPAWAPSIVFTDGTKTYIDFPSAERAAYAPVLFAIDRKGKRTLVNYRVEGTYYVVDQVLERAELALNTNDGNVITIMRTDR